MAQYTLEQLQAEAARRKAGGGGGPRPAPSEWGPGAILLPNGEVMGPPGPRGGRREKLGSVQPDGSVAPEIKEYQGLAAGRATLMDQGWSDYQEALREGYNPGDWKNALALGLEGWGVGNFAADVIRDNASERGRAAELQFVDGALRTTSGAAAPEPEVVRANRAYFRQPGESPGVEPNKAELRQRFRDQAVRIAGPAYVPPAPPAAPAKPRIASEAAMRAQQAGATEGFLIGKERVKLDTRQPRGSAANPFIAKDDAVLAGLARRKPGAYVITADGKYGRTPSGRPSTAPVKPPAPSGVSGMSSEAIKKALGL